MKRHSLILLFILVCGVVGIHAEEAQKDKASKDYSQWLPAQGDWSVGFSLDPLTTFLGNTFNNSTNNSLDDFSGEGLLNNMASIMGSYMITDKVAFRANIGLSIGRQHDKRYVADDKSLLLDPLSRDKVEDGIAYSETGGSIALGVDYRVGERRVQGVFGGGIVYAFSTEHIIYNYGNAITEANQCPTIRGGVSYESVASYMPNARPMKNFNYDGTHAFGLYGTIGIEWFVAPKISLGASVNVILAYSMSPDRYLTYEGWNTLTMAKEEYTELTYPSSNGFTFGTENIGANLYAAFYF